MDIFWNVATRYSYTAKACVRPIIFMFYHIFKIILCFRIPLNIWFYNTYQRTFNSRHVDLGFIIYERISPTNF